MGIVAVAGGTGAVGRTLVNAIVGSGNHEVFVLSRSATKCSDPSGPQHLVVDYNDADQIESMLREQRIEVVVSALVLLDEAASNSQINLIRGAARSGTVSKFIPSEYHLDFHVPIEGIELSFKKFQLKSEHELELHPQLTWTLIRNGLFLDYLAMPFHPKPTNLMPWSIFIDIQHEKCVFPGDGTQTMIFTHSADLAAYVECLISLPAVKWPRHSLIQTNKVKLKDIAQIVQNITGRSFIVVYDSADIIRRGQITPLLANKNLFADPTWGDLYQLVEKEAMFTLLSNGYDLTGENLSNLFPEVQTTSIEEFMKDAWALKQSKMLDVQR